MKYLLKEYIHVQHPDIFETYDDAYSVMIEMHQKDMLIAAAIINTDLEPDGRISFEKFIFDFKLLRLKIEVSYYDQISINTSMSKSQQSIPLKKFSGLKLQHSKSHD